MFKNEYYKDRFRFLDRTRNETKNKLSRLFENKDIYSPVYIVEWTDDGTNIVGIGCRDDLQTVKITFDDVIKPSLFVVTKRPNTLQCVVQSIVEHDVNIIVYHDILYKSNDFELFDTFIDVNNECMELSKLAKIELHSMREVMQVFSKLKYDNKSFKYGAVLEYWDASKQILFELIVRRAEQQKREYYEKNGKNCNEPWIYKHSEVPKITHRWFLPDLRIVSMPKPDLPIISFDIETVSIYPDRVPYGTNQYDELFSVSIHYTHTRTMYSLIYIPIPDKTTKDLYEELIKLDHYPKYDNNGELNIIEVYNDERSLLKRTMKLLHLNNTMHYLIGYNSLNYDIKYLLTRCQYYNIDVDRFIWRDGFCCEFSQIHIDLFIIARIRYNLKRYTLRCLSQEILKDDKTDVNAVALRYTFHIMRKYKKLFSHCEWTNRFKKPSVYDTILYNNQDTFLVSQLEEKTKAIDFYGKVAHSCRTSTFTLNTNCNSMKFRTTNTEIIVGLSNGNFLTLLKTGRQDITIPFFNPMLPLNTIDYRIHSQYSDTLLNVTTATTVKDSNSTKTSVYTINDGLNSNSACGVVGNDNPFGKISFPGGANYCWKEDIQLNIESCDYRTAYSLLIDRKNLSDETVEIVQASILAKFYPFIREPYYYTTYDYMTHAGDTKPSTKIIYHQYIYEGLYCGGEFPFTLDELKKREDSPVIIIWNKRRGVLADIISTFNVHREETKNTYKLLNGITTQIEEEKSIILEIENLRQIQLLEQQQQGTQNKEDVNCEITEDDEFEENENNNDDDDDDDEFEECEKLNLDDDNDNNDSNNNNCDDDDDEFESNEITEDNDTTIIEENTNNPTNGNEKMFDFENEFIQVYKNGTCIINRELLLAQDKPLEILDTILKRVNILYNEYESSYRLQKVIVSSIYGCLSARKPRLGGAITCMIRSVALLSAQYLWSTYGIETHYMDTDSFLITNPNGIDVCTILNNKYPETELESKMINRCLFVQKKIYYYWYDDHFRFTQHVNGPPIWRDVVDFFAKNTNIHDDDDIYNLFRLAFSMMYDRVNDETTMSEMKKKKKTNKTTTTTSTYEENFNLFAQTIIVKSEEYKMISPPAEYKNFVTRHHPDIANNRKHEVFYLMDQRDVTKTILRPISTLKHMKDVNLFKFIFNVYKTIFNIIKFSIRENTKPHFIVVNEDIIKMLMLRAYLDVYVTRFSEFIDEDFSNAQNESIKNISTKDLYDYDDFSNNSRDNDDENEYSEET